MSALRTISLRLRGTSVQILEEMGEETDGVIESVSKLQAKIKALSGVDILTDTGAYKDTYTILSEIGTVWEDMSDIDQAALLELMAGKNRANTLSAILSNMEDLEGAYESAMNAEGSALKENEAYLDSIQGRIDLFNNSVQTMWMNAIDSDVVKGIVDLGRGLIEIVDKLGLVKTAVAGIFTYFTTFSKNKIDFASMFGIHDMEDGWFAKFNKQGKETVATFNELSKALNSVKNVEFDMASTANAAQQMDILTKKWAQGQETFVGYVSSLGDGDAALKAYAASVKDGQFSLAGFQQFITQHNAQVKASGIAAKAAAIGHQLLNAALSMGITMLASFAIQALTTAIDKMIVTTKEAIEAGQEAADTIKSIKDELDSTGDTVSDISERFAELAQGVDMFNGKNISLTNEEYEEFLDLSNKLADLFPTLTRHYDENGNAIVQLAGDTDTIVGSLQNLLDIERQIANQKIVSNLPDLYKGVKAQSDEYQIELDALEAEQNSYKNALSSLSESGLQSMYDTLFTGLRYKLEGSDFEAVNAIYNAYADVFEQVGLRLERDAPVSNFEFDGYYFGLSNFYLDDYTEEELAEIKKNLSVAMNDIAEEYSIKIDELGRDIQIINNKKKSNWSSLTSSIIAWVSQEDSYANLSDEMQMVVQTMINNIDFDAFDGANKWDQAAEYIKNSILAKFENMEPEIQQAFTELFQIQSSDMSTYDYISQIRSKAQEIANQSDFTYSEILKDTGYDEIIKIYEQHAKSILRVLDDNIPEYYKQYEAGSYTYLSLLDSYADEMLDLNNKIYSLSPDELIKAFNLIKKYGLKTWDELEEALNNKTFDVVIDMATESDGFENLYKAIEESLSATGLSAESITELKKRYQDLENYDPSKLFEKTENGIHLNVKALRELEEAYEQQQLNELNGKLESLTKHYNKLTKEIDECDDMSKTSDLYAQRDNILEQIKDTALLASQYEGLTSAYNKWQKAQSSGNERDMYEGIISGRKSMDELMSRGWVDDEVRAFIDLLSGKDLSTASVDEVLAAYKELNNVIGNSGYTVYDFFTTDEDGNATTEGLFNFFDTVRSEVGETYAWIDEQGKYHLDFGIGGDQTVADKLGMDVEAVQALMRAASDAGFDINLDSVYSQIDYLKTEAEQANDKLKELKITATTFNFNTDDVDILGKQISDAKALLEKFRLEDGTIDIDAPGAIEVQKILATLLSKKQQLTDTAAILQIDVSAVDEASSEIDQAMKLLYDFKTKYQEYEIKVAIGADVTETEKELDGYLKEMQENSIITGTLNVDPTSKETAIDDINSLTPEMIAQVIPDDSAIKAYDPNEEAKSALVEYGIDPESEVFRWNPPDKKGTIYYTAASTLGGYIFDKMFGGNQANGTANANGSWGAPRTETSLVGELGPELLVRGNRWTTIGDNGAEFTQVKKGDIIFNHKQTEELLKNGHITSRGKAYASGTAYSNSSGLGRTSILEAHIAGGGATRLEEDLNKASDSADEFAETIDWIDIRMSEFGNKLDLYSTQLENAATVVEKNNIIDNMIDVNKTMAAQAQAGATYYQLKANTYLSGLSASLQEAAKNGAIAIGEFTDTQDEATVEAIKKYREYTQKAADLTKQAAETIAEIRDLAIQRIDNVQTYGNARVNIEDLQTQKLQNAIEYIETSGYVPPAEYYGVNGGDAANSTGMFENSYKKIEYWTEALQGMQTEFNDAVANGEIVEGSTEWYEQLAKLYEADTEIQKARLEIEQFQNAINDLYWDNFDELINRLDYINDESSNMIDILSHSDMFETPEGTTHEGGTIEFWNPKDVEWTEEGMATLGLYAQQMESAQFEAAQYEEAIEALNVAYGEGKYSESEYLAKLNELKNGQKDCIDKYYDAKDAIQDLNKERIEHIKKGIEAEIDAYEELIKKQKEALDSEKDLYDFEKSIQKQEKNIADIKRKLAALENDTSMSAAAERKKLQAELAEAEYELEESYLDRSYTDKQNALDAELEDFTAAKDAEIAKWDEYVNDVDTLLTNTFDLIKKNASGIYDTLDEKSIEHGVTLSSAITTPWTDGENAIGNYSAKFDGEDGLNADATGYGTTLSGAITGAWGDGETAIDNYNNKFTATISANLSELALIKAQWQEVINLMSDAALGNPIESDILDQNVVDAIDDVIDNAGGSIPEINAANDAYVNLNNTDGYGINPSNANGSSDEPTYTDYKVVAGDNLWNIAKALTDSALNWEQIYLDNEDIIGSDPNLIYPGQVLKIRNKYASGTSGVKDDQFAWLDELGDELVLHADGSGRLSYLTKGTAVIPHDISENLISLGQLDPSDILNRNAPQIGMSPSVVNNTIELTMEIGEVVHIDNVSNDTIPDLTKAIEKQLDKYMKNVNNNIRKYTR